MSKIKLKGVVVASLILLGAGCARMPSLSLPNPLDLVAGPAIIHVEIVPQTGAKPLLRAGQPVSLAVTTFKDVRAGQPGRTIGSIKATVSNMHGTELSLDQDVSALLQSATSTQLVADGFRLVSGGERADFILGVSIRIFSLNISGTDELMISADVALRDGTTGEVVWSGLISEQADRFAGVSGNSRATIVDFLGERAAFFIGKTSAVLRDSLVKAYPQSLTLGPMPTDAIPGVSVAKVAAPEKSLPRAVTLAPAAVAVPSVPPAVATSATGILWLSSAPSRAKIYVDDVYYGLTPLKLELPVGVTQMHFKLEGFNVASEKVAVRRGETTELDIKFQK